MSDSDTSRPRSWIEVQVDYALNSAQFQKALSDLWSGWTKRTLWMTIGLHDIRQRYRRSVIGPFWITISTGIMIGAMGVLYSQIFKIDTSEYLPFLAAGFFVWGLISSLLNDGCQTFIASENLIKQLSAPLSTYAYRVLWSSLLTAAHNIWIFVIVAVWYQIDIGLSVLLFVPALAIMLFNGLWVCLLLGLLSARFRDIPMIVGSIVQVMFFITPVLWKPDMLPGRALLLDANPLYHFVEIMRGPMLGQLPSGENWFACILMTAVGWIITLIFYTAYRWRLAYWV
jgi:ABC-2 type transport system permease protein